jgi:hypothetical protein
MKFSIDIVADYGGKTGFFDLAFAEVKNKIASIMQENNFQHSVTSCLSVNAFNTIETGFIVAQLGLNSTLKQHIIYHNTAPRKDNTEKRKNNDGEGLAMALLPNNVLIVGVFAGYTFSFLKNIAKIYRLDCQNVGSQFRSRDTFPQAMINIAKEVYIDGLTDLSKSKYCLGLIDNIPDIHDNTILYIDGYGNIKTSLPASILNEQKAIKTIINETAHNIYVSTDGIFGTEDGNMVIAKGSSGWNGVDNARFLEISLRGGNASNVFNNPKPGDKIIFSA